MSLKLSSDINIQFDITKHLWFWQWTHLHYSCNDPKWRIYCLISLVMIIVWQRYWPDVRFEQCHSVFLLSAKLLRVGFDQWAVHLYITWKAALLVSPSLIFSLPPSVKFFEGAPHRPKIYHSAYICTSQCISCLRHAASGASLMLLTVDVLS